MVLEVPAPLSLSSAPNLLRGWLAQVLRTNMRRSKAESTEKTPTKTPAGGNASKSGGGNGEGGDAVVNRREAKDNVDIKESGGADGEGAEQYARHGKGSLSGLRIYISRRVRKTAKTERRRSVRTYEKTVRKAGALGDNTHDGDGLPGEERMSVETPEPFLEHASISAVPFSATTARGGAYHPPAPSVLSPGIVALGSYDGRVGLGVGVGGAGGGRV